MNQARTTYQTDFTPFDWLQNNFGSDMNEFCSPENIDECLKYISQEFCALGYPSIYSSSSDCPFAVNCDIVKFLNATFELLKCHSDYTQSKENLEDRNQRLSADLHVLSKKNAQLRNTLEQNERKLASALERERQLKEKNEQLSQLLKTEREETKKLTAQIRQQKVAHQHEIRKYEVNMNHVKAKLNQLLSDKNPNKKIANISISHTLIRNTGQRGKWKTGATATTAIEDMYNSVITNYETRCKDMYKELNSSRQCLQSVLSQMVDIVFKLKDVADGSDCVSACDEFVLSEMKNGCQNSQILDEKFKYLLAILKEAASKRSSDGTRNLENELKVLKLKLFEYEKALNKSDESQKAGESQEDVDNKKIRIDAEEITKSLASEIIKKEKMKLEEEKKAFLRSLEKERTEISSQKLAVLRLAMQQNASPSSWHHSLNAVPSISVITSRDGACRISSANILKSSLSTPDQSEKFYSPQWMSPEQNSVERTQLSKSDSTLEIEKKTLTPSFIFSPVTDSLNFSNSDLPTWATKRSEIQTIEDEIPTITLEASQHISNNNTDLPVEPSSEEISLQRLRAAIEDIEKRRNNIS